MFVKASVWRSLHPDANRIHVQILIGSGFGSALSIMVGSEAGQNGNADPQTPSSRIVGHIYPQLVDEETFHIHEGLLFYTFFLIKKNGQYLVYFGFLLILGK
jgi:hypothetical protein